eukprot:m.82526 g.82526  ORF g.82526 m.82526 type:complete len:106 (+) comp50780_c1_seq10:332-649(+)
MNLFVFLANQQQAWRNRSWWPDNSVRERQVVFGVLFGCCAEIVFREAVWNTGHGTPNASANHFFFSSPDRAQNLLARISSALPPQCRHESSGCIRNVVALLSHSY